MVPDTLIPLTLVLSQIFALVSYHRTLSRVSRGARPDVALAVARDALGGWSTAGVVASLVLFGARLVLVP